MALSAADRKPHAKFRFGADPERSATLPAYYFYDPEIYQREKEEVFYKTWQFAGYLSDLQTPGDYITAEIIDQKILVVRGKDQRLRAFHNVCKHRGHVLTEGSGNKSIFTCPFHAWSYDTTGELKAAGNSENVFGFERTDFHLSEVRVEPFANMVFVNLDLNATSLSGMASDLEAEFETIVPRFSELTHARTEFADLRCNWKFAHDQMECYHCPVIHPQIMGEEDSYFELSFDMTEHGYWTQHFIAGNKEVIERGGDDLPYDFNIHGDDVLQDAYIWYLWPNCRWVAHNGVSNWKLLHVMPTGVETCRQRIDYFFLNDPLENGDLELMDYFTNVLQPQDFDSLERQQLGVHCRGYQQGRLMVDQERSWRSEHGTHHFDKLLWDALNGPNYQ